MSIAFYYKDPDGNIIELFENFANWDRSREYMRSSPDFNTTVKIGLSGSIGTFVDAEKLVAARNAVCR